MRRPLYIANWKMNKTEIEAREYLRELLLERCDRSASEVAVAPPFTSLRTAGEVLEGSGVRLAAQDLHWESAGAYTGEVSGRMLAELNVRYVLVGHSERRIHFGETDERVARKTRGAQKAGLVPVVCLGESEPARQAGRTETVIEGQLRLALAEANLARGGDLVIAYEPVWAIGTGRTATPEQVGGAHRFLREVLASVAGRAIAEETRILYGGSVTPHGVGEIAALPEVDGCLVGGASLIAASFIELVRSGVAARRDLPPQSADPAFPQAP